MRALASVAAIKHVSPRDSQGSFALDSPQALSLHVRISRQRLYMKSVCDVSIGTSGKDDPKRGIIGTREALSCEGRSIVAAVTAAGVQSCDRPERPVARYWPARDRLASEAGLLWKAPSARPRRLPIILRRGARVVFMPNTPLHHVCHYRGRIWRAHAAKALRRASADVTLVDRAQFPPLSTLAVSGWRPVVYRLVISPTHCARSLSMSPISRSSWPRSPTLMLPSAPYSCVTSA